MMGIITTRFVLGIWQILLDFWGGVLSDAQLVLDCLDMGDWTGITGNLAKFFLGFVSISFDTAFMLQHYAWYPHSAPLTSSRSAEGAPAEYADATSEETSALV
jgi:cystinosin